MLQIIFYEAPPPPHSGTLIYFIFPIKDRFINAFDCLDKCQTVSKWQPKVTKCSFIFVPTHELHYKVKAIANKREKYALDIDLVVFASYVTGFFFLN